jgi:outer membrane protein assembly factor BamB
MTAGSRWGVLVLLAGAMAACSGSSSGPTCSFDDPASFPRTAAPSGTPHPWAKFHYDLQNTGSVVNPNVSGNPGTCRWVFPPGGWDSCTTALSTPPKGGFAASPVISNDGSRIYIGSADGTLYALNAADGTPITDFSSSVPQPTPITSTALVAARPIEGEVVFVGDYDGDLQGVTNTGAAQPTYWPSGIGGIVSSSPNIGGDGTVYVTSLGGAFVGVCPNGVGRFSLSTGPSQSSPAQGPDGTLYFGTDYGMLDAVQPNGTVNWAFSAAGPIRAAPVFDTATNSIYVADRMGRVFKVIAGGSLAGRPDASFAFGQVGPISSSPALAEDHIYLGSDDGNLYAIDKCTGALAWQFATGSAIVSSPAVAIIASEPLQPTTCSSSGPPVVHQRIVVVGSDDGNVYFLQDNGTSVALVAVFSIGAPVGFSSPAIGSDGTVYVGASDGRVYAIGEPLPSPTPSS